MRGRWALRIFPRMAAPALRHGRLRISPGALTRRPGCSTCVAAITRAELAIVYAMGSTQTKPSVSSTGHDGAR